MWRNVWGQVFGEWNEQPKGPWEKDEEDWMGASCMESGTNNQRAILSVLYGTFRERFP